MQDGHRLDAFLGNDVPGRRRALLVVATDGAEDELALLALGQLRRGRGRRHHHHALVLVDLRGGNRRSRTEVADHEPDPLADDLVGDRHGLLGFAGIVHHDDLKLAPAGAACSIDLLDRRQHTGLCHVSVLRDGAAHGASQSDLHRFRVRGRAKACKHGRSRNRKE
ncbi:hypothetical protein D3C72_1603280 [compost metagenome]